jgi:hypothetical protein
VNCQREGETCDYSIRLNWEGRGKKKPDSDKMAMELERHANLGELPYREIQTGTAVTAVHGRGGETMMEWEKDIWRKHRRQMTIQNNIEQQGVALAIATAAKDKARQRLIREKDSSAGRH